MEGMKWIEDLDVRGVCTQGIVLDGGTTRIYIAWFPPEDSLPTTRHGSAAGNGSSFQARC
jgi:hypothetical protein